VTGHAIHPADLKFTLITRTAFSGRILRVILRRQCPRLHTAEN
jgi:hypothetical protein